MHMIARKHMSDKYLNYDVNKMLLLLGKANMVQVLFGAW